MINNSLPPRQEECPPGSDFEKSQVVLQNQSLLDEPKPSIHELLNKVHDLDEQVHALNGQVQELRLQLSATQDRYRIDECASPWWDLDGISRADYDDKDYFD